MKKILMILLFVSLSVMAAEKNNRPGVTIDDVETYDAYTPIYEGDEGGDTLQLNGMSLDQRAQKRWFRIAVEYETEPEWIDHLTIEFYLLMPGEDKILFKGIVQYVDIPKGRDHLAEMYMHFNSYERYRNRGKFKTAVVIKIHGEVVAVSKPNSLETAWWADKQVHPCGLLNRLDTPFRIANVDKYEAQDFCSWE
jgi:hypothetical protein